MLGTAYEPRAREARLYFPAASRNAVLGFRRVQGLGFKRVQGLGFKRVQGLGFRRVQGLGSRV